MTLYALGEITPALAPDAWVAPDANVIGQIVLKGAQLCLVWFYFAWR